MKTEITLSIIGLIISVIIGYSAKVRCEEEREKAKKEGKPDPYDDWYGDGL